jgi:PAS domain-containing protein
MELSSQRPIELILARNLLSSLSTPAFLASGPGEIIFYNEAAGAMLGQRFEETGKMSPEEWTSRFGPLAEDGKPIPLEEQALTIALRANRAGHAL